MEEVFPKLESFILEKIRSTRIPGLSVAAVRGGEVVYSKGFGFRDISTGLPATPYTIYGIGSVTKSFTALAIMKLVEEGKLSLDDPVEKFVSLKLKVFGEPVRVHHLLTHSCGIPALAYAEAFIRGTLNLDESWLPLASPEDVVSFMKGAENWAVAKPGEKFFYLNEGYVLLGQIVSKVSGVRYEEFVKKTILEPLNMDRTYFFKEDVERDLDVATPYVVDREGKHVPGRFPYGVTADGGLLSNAVDMVKYATMYLNRGKFGDAVIVSEESIEVMVKPYIRVPFQVFGDESYGYGLIVSNQFFDRKLVWHSGSVLVYTAFMGYLPSDKIGVAVLSNASGYPLMNIGLYALALLLGRDPDKDLPLIRNERILEDLQGVYETYKGAYKVTVRKREDFMFVEYRDRYLEISRPLVPEEIKEDYVKLYTIMNNRKLYVKFYKEDGRWVALYERYKLVKRSPLPQ